MRSINIMTIGDTDCGKTALLLAMQQTDFKFENAKYILPTVYDHYQVNFKLHGDDVTVNLHDTSGQEDYDRLRPLLYGRGIDVVLLVFSVISTASFENINHKLIPETNRHLKNVPRILVESRHDETILANLKKMKQMPVEQRDIDEFCKSHSLKYFETSAETGDGVEACLYAAIEAGLAFKYGKNYILHRLKMHVLEHARHILRPFVVEKILPVIKKDWVAFCVKIGFNKNTVTLAKNKRVINPLWQILRFWTETVETSRADPSKILYKGLSKVNKSLKRDLLEWIVRDSEKNNIQEIIPDTFEVNIRRHYQIIIQEISVSQILDQMMTHCSLSIDDRRHIEQHVQQIEQNKALLDIVIDRNRYTFNVFIDALRESKYDDMVDLLSSDLEDITVDTPCIRTAQMEGLSAWTVPLHKVRLQKNYVDIISTIKHEAIVDHLISSEVFTIDDQQTIEACPAQTEKNRKLMDRLLHCGEKCFIEFLNALRSDEMYADLANQIEHTNVTSIDIASLHDCYSNL
ncbi:Hypothetical predicted protein [Mytilus galloprovincialis]|uniref:CARD domain-containing protein n=1 Tax=Mytilus galloprovincialis TaxID=29158 RepID=A0A8B6C345_MYTGA|nr:Hypothetical predicted protein [Mytilus galloprovincialis]